MEDEIIYTTGSVEGTLKDEMKKRNIKDSSKITVKKWPDPKIDSIYAIPKEMEDIYKGAHYLAKLTYQDSTITTPIEIPSETLSHNFLVDTTDNYFIKKIWPKNTGDGMTGIYVEGLKGSFNFNMYARNLNDKNQKLLLRAFETLKINKKVLTKASSHGPARRSLSQSHGY